jgi:CPA2 family monovalent cation:H+ antiporter-2
LLKVGAFLAVMLDRRAQAPAALAVVGGADRIARSVHRWRSVACAVGIAYGAGRMFDVSFALGAFFAGMVLRESESRARAAHESLPLRDAFAVLFFVSVGMLFDPMVLVNEPLRVLTVVGIIVFGKTLAAALLVLLLRLSAEHGAHGLGQPGADRRVLLHPRRAGRVARLAAGRRQQPDPGRRADFHRPQSLPCSRRSNRLQQWLRERSAIARRLEQPVDPMSALPMSTDAMYLSGHVVLVGYGG